MKMCWQVVSKQVKSAYGFAKGVTDSISGFRQLTEHLVQTIGFSVLAIEKNCNCCTPDALPGGVCHVPPGTLVSPFV